MAFLNSLKLLAVTALVSSLQVGAQSDTDFPWDNVSELLSLFNFSRAELKQHVAEHNRRARLGPLLLRIPVHSLESSLGLLIPRRWLRVHCNYSISC
jgi:hypothetical protein